MAGVAGLEPVTSAVTGQRSNQLSYTPAKGRRTIRKFAFNVKFWFGFLNIIHIPHGHTRRCGCRMPDSPPNGNVAPGRCRQKIIAGDRIASSSNLAVDRCEDGKIREWYSNYALTLMEVVLEEKIRAADAKEVGVGNPAEETYCYPNKNMLRFSDALSTPFHQFFSHPVQTTPP